MNPTCAPDCLQLGTSQLSLVTDWAATPLRGIRFCHRLRHSGFMPSSACKLAVSHLEYVEIAPMPGKQAASNHSDDRHCPLMQPGGTILVDIVFLVVQRYVGN